MSDFGNCAGWSALAEKRCGYGKCRFCCGKCRFCLPHPDRPTVGCSKGELDAGFFDFGAARRVASLMARALRVFESAMKQEALHTGRLEAR